MSGTLEFEFRFGKGKKGAPSRPSFRILVLADLAGATARQLPLAQRFPQTVDIDNFAATLAAFAPTLTLPASGDHAAPTGTLHFSRLDDLHPDAIYEMPPFAALRASREALADPQRSAMTAADLGLSVEAPARPESDADTLNRLLGGSATRARPVTADIVNRLVRDVVTQHVSSDDRALRQRALGEFDQRIARHLRTILRDPAFRRLESAWRGIWHLVSELSGDDEIQVDLLDLSRDELQADLSAGGNALRAALADSVGEDGPLSLIVADFSFTAAAADLDTLDALARLAMAADAPCLAAAQPALLGCASVDELADPAQWQPLAPPLAERWQALRKSQAAAWLGLTLPRLLGRLPYGRNTDPVSAFAFEEVADGAAHEDFAWENPVYAQARLLGEAYAEDGDEMDISAYLEIDALPSYIVRDVRGDARQQAGAEVLLGETAANAMLARGLMPLLSYRNRDAVRLLRWQSVAAPARPLAGVFAT
ncbi:type VI secretion system contractile sheath domain-containing protein [Azonexus sp.]|uniref:type VI secretion system contractile sheath domain-containing protein n=1 Tax=Azonexus sp. TaxID=1872668 RepID=UPI0035B032EE